MKTKMQTGGTNPKKKERLTNRSEKVMKKAVKNWEFARDVSASGTTNKGELDVAEAMQNRAVKQGDRAKKIRAKAEKYQVGGVTNAGSDSIKAKAAAAAKAKAMKAMKTTGSKVGKMGTDTAKKYQTGGATKKMPIKSKPLDSNQVYRTKKLSPAGAKEYMRKYGRPTKKMQMGGPSMYQGPAAAQQPTEDMAMDMNMNPMAQRQSSYKIGGMVNPNSNVSKQTVPGSRGVKSGVNPKAAASKVARGTVGGTSTAPSKAIPKAQMGGAQGRSISEKAANRKVSKGKGMISYRVGDKTVPGSPENKGQYIGFSRDARKDNKSGKTIGIRMSDAKPSREIRQVGGAGKVTPYTPGYQPDGTPKAGGAKLKKPKAFTRGAARKFHKMIKKS